MPESTHDLEIGETTVVKTFRSWGQSEPDREWSGLQLLNRYAPGLTPKPIERGLVAGRPSVVMSKISGSSLGRTPATDAQTIAVATALRRLHHSVPETVVATLPVRVFGPDAAVALVRERMTHRPSASAEVMRAFDAGAAWIDSHEASRFAKEEPPLVFAQADGNLANFLWDGSRCRLVDFEDSGASDEAFEIADLVEHPSAWLSGALEGQALLTNLDLSPAVGKRVIEARRVHACYWLTMLLPGQPAQHRNPPDSIDRQATRLLSLL